MVLGKLDSYLQKKEMKTLMNITYKKINTKWIKNLYVRLDTIKVLEEIARLLSEKNHSKIIFDLPPGVIKIKTKINKWDLTKFKSFCVAKETINKMKVQHTEWEKIFANKVNSQRIIFQNIQRAQFSSVQFSCSVVSESLQSKRQTTQSENGQKI